NGRTQLLVERVTGNGVPDPSLGVGGRVTLGLTSRCYGPVQPAGLPAGRIVAAADAATGSLCNVGFGQTAVVDASGQSPSAFSSQFLWSDRGNATGALLARPDGLVLHGSAYSFRTDPVHAVFVEQALPDGTLDAQF